MVLGLALGGLGGCGGGTCDEPGVICTIAGNGAAGYEGDDGPAVDARMSEPMDLAVAPGGELWVLDFNNFVVRAIDADGIIRTVVGSNRLGDSPAPGEATIPVRQAELNHTPDLAFHDGILYLAAWHNSRIKRVDLSAGMLENYAGIGRRELYTGDGGPALEAAVDGPSSVAVDPDGNLVLFDQFNQVIRRVLGDGTIETIAGTCVAVGWDPVAGYQTCAPGEEPVACPGSEKVTCGDPDLTTSGCDWGGCDPAFAGDGGQAIAARFNQPFGDSARPGGRIAFDPAGNLYVVDRLNHRVRRIDRDGIITTIAGTGDPGYAGDGGPATEAQLTRPVDVEVAADGVVYVADTGNHCVRAIDRAGVISTVAGRCVHTAWEGESREGPTFSGDGGQAVEADLDTPYGIELAGDRLYIADSWNHRIRVVSL
jgi:DNA-binding beta-propeller fold protein YncE